MKKLLILMIAFVAIGMIAGVVVVLRKNAQGLLPQGGNGGQNTSATVPNVVISSPSNDKDGDGLTNEEEEQTGTSPTAFDTDRDGLFDRDETHVWRTDPRNSDSDGDGFSDGIEVIRGYNPAGAGAL